MMQIPKNWGENILKGQFSPVHSNKRNFGVTCGKLPGKLVASLDKKIAPIVPQVWILDDESSDVIFTWLHWSVHHCYNTYSLGPEWQGCLFGIGEEQLSRNLWNDKGRKPGDVVRPINWSGFFFPTRSGPHFVAFFFGLAVWHSWGLWYRRPSELLECLGPNLLWSKALQYLWLRFGAECLFLHLHCHAANQNQLFRTFPTGVNYTYMCTSGRESVQCLPPFLHGVGVAPKAHYFWEGLGGQKQLHWTQEKAGKCTKMAC